MVEHREYDAFGAIDQVFDAAGVAKNSASLLSDTAFAGRTWDQDAGLYYNRARWYEPESGRFISEDPIGFGDGPNVYRYAGNNPVTFVDPSGLAIASPLDNLGIGNSLASASTFGSFGGSSFSTSQLDTGFDFSGPVAPTVSDFNRSLLDNSFNTLGTSNFVLKQGQQTRQALAFQNPTFQAKPGFLSQAAAYATGAARGLVTSGKSLFNAGADTAVGLATLGFKESPIRFTPTQTDINNGFGASNLAFRGSLELASGLLTGGASQLGKVGTAVAVLDVAGNAVSAGRGAIDIAQNGVSLQNSVQLVGGGLGLGANAAGIRGAIAPKRAATPSELARSFQGSDRFPGVDRFRDITLKKGTVVYAGEPGQSGFFTTASGLRRAGTDATKLFNGLQVPPRQGLFRPGVTAFEILEDTPAAFGKVRANPQFGSGGLPQLFVPDFQGKVKPIVTHILQNRVAP